MNELELVTTCFPSGSATVRCPLSTGEHVAFVKQRSDAVGGGEWLVAPPVDDADDVEVAIDWVYPEVGIEKYGRSWSGAAPAKLSSAGCSQFMTAVLFKAMLQHLQSFESGW